MVGEDGLKFSLGPVAELIQALAVGRGVRVVLLDLVEVASELGQAVVVLFDGAVLLAVLGDGRRSGVSFCETVAAGCSFSWESAR